VSSTNQPPDEPPPPYPRRRGRIPKPTSHPLGRLIRDRRLAKGLSLAQLAEAVGIGPTSVSLIAAMEHGSIPPRRDVAERLADVLELDREPLLMWADTRMSWRAREELETRVTSWYSPLPELPSGRLIGPGTQDVRGSAQMPLLDRLAGGSAAEPPPTQIPILPAGKDPDRYRRRPLEYLDRHAMERLIGGRAELINPIAYELSDEDFERLRRVAHPLGRPRHALVSRPTPIAVDPREPYAIRFGSGVILAYCAWDGRELVVLQPPGDTGFARLKARGQAALDRHVVGQVVALNWWEPSKADSTGAARTAT
jgi:transcriptional regulator with XRE-family HTH domain